MNMPGNTRDLTVVSRLDDRGDVVRLTLADPSGADLPEVTAGAHIDLRVALPEGEVWRQYSLAGDPANRKEWQLGILRKADGRGGSRRLAEIAQKAAVLSTDGPRNHFALAPGGRHHVLIGGGIGITPLLSMAYELARCGARFELHYCTRGPERTAFLDLLDQPPFAGATHLHHDGTATAFDPAELPQPDDGTHLYVCGPEGFMDHVIGAAQAIGHAAGNIHREYFSNEVDSTGDTFVVEARASGVTVTVGAEESIVAALARAGIAVEVKCEEGICGTCLTDVLEGEPDHRDHFLTDDEKAENAAMCLCCSRARSTLLVLDI